MKTRENYVDLLRSWIGRNEKDGTHQYIIDIYNNYRPLARGYKVKYTDSWCATTVSAAAIQVGCTDIIPLECSCGKMIELAQRMGIWEEKDDITPLMGDIIMYDWDDTNSFSTTNNTGWPEHVGVVETIDTNKNLITVIEGNLNNSVSRRILEINGKYIRGYIKPNFDKENTINEVEEMRYFEIVDPTGMNMRTEPNKTLVQSIPQGVVISGNSFKALNGVDWLYTTYNGKTGYVAVLPESKGYAKEVTSQYNQPAPAPAVNWEAKYNEVVNQLNNVNSQISTLTTQVNDLSNANGILSTQLAAANELIDTLENDKIVLEYANGVLKTEKDNLEGNLADIQKSCGEAKEVINEFKVAWEKLMK